MKFSFYLIDVHDQTLECSVSDIYISNKRESE